ncbi:MAG: hypothetical protein CM1200mP33_0190 [Chloroflexota bacterium]|nr:MAG: hypothetical protein CM1200mP33_0190 [Chloroflexota bacterium]
MVCFKRSAFAPPYNGWSTGVSTSKNPSLSKYDLSADVIIVLFLKTSFTSGLQLNLNDDFYNAVLCLQKNQMFHPLFPLT